MKRSQLILLLSVVFALLIGGYFYLTSGSKKPQILEIKFISDHANNDNGFVPSYINIFADVYENESGTPLLANLNYKRSDIAGASTEFIQFSLSIDSDTDPETARSKFASERSALNATTSMKLPDGSDAVDITNDTINTVTFYLNFESRKPDNIKLFNNAHKLKEHIRMSLSSNKLFESGIKPNTIIVVLKKGDNYLPTELDEIARDPLPSPRTNTPPSETVVTENGPKRYDAKIKINGNNISWNSALSSANNLVITFTSNIDGKILVSDNVTGKSNYYFSYSNSVYEGSNIQVKLSATFDDASTIINNSKVTSSLECH